MAIIPYTSVRVTSILPNEIFASSQSISSGVWSGAAVAATVASEWRASVVVDDDVLLQKQAAPCLYCTALVVALCGILWRGF